MRYFTIATLTLAVAISGVQSSQFQESHSLGKYSGFGQGIFYSTIAQRAFKFAIAALQGGDSYQYTNAKGVTRTYPEQYFNWEGLSSKDCDEFSGPFFEFPAFDDGTSYKGGFPGAHRAVVRLNSDGTYTPCWFMTHEGRSNNGFRSLL